MYLGEEGYDYCVRCEVKDSDHEPSHPWAWCVALAFKQGHGRLQITPHSATDKSK